MNNTTPIKALTAAVLLTFGLGLTAHAAPVNKGASEMNHEQTVSDTLSARQQAIPLIAASMASSQMDKLNAALNQGLDAGLKINETKEILVQLYAYTGFPRSLNALNELMKVVEARKQRGVEDVEGKEPVAAIPVGDELRRVGTANQTKISGAPVQDLCLILPRSLINSYKRICSATFSPAITSTGKAASWQRLAH